MKIKKVLCTLLAVACALPAVSLAACGEKQPNENPGGGDTVGKNVTYTFEAEYTDIEGKQGAGLSSEPFGFSLIYGNGGQADKDKGWSNGYYIAHTYKDGFTLEFKFKAAAAGTGVLSLRLGSELGTLDLTPSSFGVVLNDKEITYTGMQVQGSQSLDTIKFYDKILPGEAEIKEGDNSLKLIVRANTFKNNATTGGPFVDCVKITTKAGLSWEPKTDNPDRRNEVEV